jgi:hypothetical protein
MGITQEKKEILASCHEQAILLAVTGWKNNQRRQLASSFVLLVLDTLPAQEKCGGARSNLDVVNCATGPAILSGTWTASLIRNLHHTP